MREEGLVKQAPRIVPLERAVKCYGCGIVVRHATVISMIGVAFCSAKSAPSSERGEGRNQDGGDADNLLVGSARIRKRIHEDCVATVSKLHALKGHMTGKEEIADQQPIEGVDRGSRGENQKDQ